MKNLIFLCAIFCLFQTIGTAQNRSNKKAVKSDKIKLVCSQAPMPSGGYGSGSDSGDLNKSSAQQFDTPVKILNKPNPVWNNSALAAANLQGTVILRVQFLSNCEIGRVQPVSGMPFGLTESSIEAARKIIFQPALKNGKPVTVTKAVEYTFAIK